MRPRPSFLSRRATRQSGSGLGERQKSRGWSFQHQYSGWKPQPRDLGHVDNLPGIGYLDQPRPAPVGSESCNVPDNGWTSHLAITDADSEEHHLDFFSKAPRVTELDHDANDHDYASRQVVAQMKKTDREKDWPIVFALGRQAVSDGDIRGVLHGQEADWLIETWSNISENERAELVRWRPLLGLIDSEPHRLRRAIAIEKQLWVSVNRERYGVYQRKWKDFFRKWRREPGFRWPPNISFDQQHHRLDEAARKHQLPMSPLDDSARQEALSKARADAAEILVASDEELARIAPPLEALLP